MAKKTMRQQFEEWHRREFGYIDATTVQRTYSNMWTFCRWQGYRAGLREQKRRSARGET